ncbi:MAG: hypothetical protein ACX932_04885 [Gammaproteobacteria bacterium]
MKIIELPASLRKNHCLYWGIAIGIVLTLVKIHQNININPDAVYYLRAAHAYDVYGIQQAMAVYPWPFYSLLISWLHHLTSLSLLTSAYILNVFFQSIMLVGFWCLVNELSGFHYIDRKKLQCIAVVVFLVFPNLNGYRDYIIRDFAYWGIFFFALWCLMRFSLSQRWYFAVLWGLLALLASSFRIEGVLITLALPFVLLFDKECSFSERVILFFLAQVVVISAGIILLFLLAIHTSSISNHSNVWLTAHLGRLYELFKAPVHTLQLMHLKHHHFIKVLSNGVLTVHAENNAATIFFYGILGVYCTKLIKYLTWLYFILGIYAIKQKLLPCRNKVIHILYGFIGLNMIITLYFTYTHYFISGRYLLLLVFSLMLWVPFGLLRIYHHWESRAPVFTAQWWVLPLLALWLVVNTVGGLIVIGGHKHHYVYRAGHWLQKTTPSHTEIFTNDQRLLYYARGPVDTWARDLDLNNDLKVIEQGKWKHYDYLAIKVGHNERRREQWLQKRIGHKPIKIFGNRQGDKIFIFKVG